MEKARYINSFSSTLLHKHVFIEQQPAR